jgi:hypothetical protein
VECATKISEARYLLVAIKAGHLSSVCKRSFDNVGPSANFYAIVRQNTSQTLNFQVIIHRAALEELLGGGCYHMATVMNERPDHHNHWRKALKGQAR